MLNNKVLIVFTLTDDPEINFLGVFGGENAQENALEKVVADIKTDISNNCFDKEEVEELNVMLEAKNYEGAMKAANGMRWEHGPLYYIKEQELK